MSFARPLIKLDDPKYLEPTAFNKVRDEIERRVKELIEKI